MKAVILAGGYGTRLSEETTDRPKPMVEIGGKPILWHIMKHYSHYGIKEFVILCGYKGYFIKEYFANYFLHQCDVTVHTRENKMDIHNNASEDWSITLVDTGLDTMTGSRLLRAKKYIGEDDFCLTYGDGLSDINISELVEGHKSKNALVTMSTVQPEGRFGSVIMTDEGQVEKFVEKPIGDGGWINGGFFVCSNEIFDFIKDGDTTVWEKEPLENITKSNKLFTHKHTGFWKCMDTLRDKRFLENEWNTGKAPWKIWD